jgi:meso-butanediol dehydrogenase/(S,S)-butanediol dehydrogenase/diacetyl reductase
MSGKVAVITGGARGIGATTSELFCREGAKVVIVDGNDDLLAQTVHRIRGRVVSAEISAFAGDVGDYEAACQAVNHALRQFGRLDTLVNNAAIRHHATVEETKVDDWNRLLSVNLLGAANFCRAAVDPLRKSGNGSIVMVSTGYALTGRKGNAAYDASKAALLSLTRTLACEEVDSNIRVNAVCPGSTATPHTIARGVARGLSEAQFHAEVRSDSLMKRWARAEEIAYPIMWLASDEASYITGATLMVDGGLSIM